MKSKTSYPAGSAWAGSGREKRDNTSSACSMICKWSHSEHQLVDVLLALLMHVVKFKYLMSRTVETEEY